MFCPLMERALTMPDVCKVWNNYSTLLANCECSYECFYAPHLVPSPFAAFLANPMPLVLNDKLSPIGSFIFHDDALFFMLVYDQIFLKSMAAVNSVFDVSGQLRLPFISIFQELGLIVIEFLLCAGSMLVVWPLG